MGLDLWGFASVGVMATAYALEARSRTWVLVFAMASASAAAYAVAIESWPFTLRERPPASAASTSTVDASIPMAASLSSMARLSMQADYLAVMTSRGCPFNCSFCVVPSMNQNKWRARSPENVVKEFQEINE